MFCGFPNPSPVNELAQMQKYSVPHSTSKMSVGGAEAIEEVCEMKGTQKDSMKPWRLRRKHIHMEEA